LSVIYGLIEVVIVGLAANELGGFLAKLFFKNKRLFADILLDEISRLALGLVGISYALRLLVALRVVYSGVLRGFLFLLALLALLRLKRLFHELSSRPSPYVFFREPEFLFLVLYLALMAFLTALPASARDELVYHLEVPRSLLAAHGEVLFRDNVYAYFPKFTEMFFLFGLGTFGEAEAKMFHLMFGVLTAFGLYRVALGWLGRIQARWAVALFLGIPSVMTVMPAAYVDLAFAFFAFMALLHVLTYCREKTLRHAVLAGIFLGAAIGVKYTGLQLSALVLCVLATAKLNDRTLPLILPAAIISGLSLALALPYFFGNLQLTGWPMFPFALPGFHLKTGLNWDPERAGLLLKYLQSFGAWPGPSGILQALLAPAAVFILGQFNQLSFYDGMVGPVFLLIPLLIFRKKMTSELQLAGWFVLFYMFYWSVTTRQVRFLLPVMPFLCLFLAWGLKEHRKKGLTVFVGLLLAFNIFCGLREIIKKDPVSYWLGKKDREAYLREQVPAYAVYSLANSLLRADDKLYLVHMKNYGYYLDRNWEADFVFERYRLEALLSLNPPAEDVERFFKEKHVTHLMVNLAPITDPLRGLDEKSREAFFRFLKQKTQALASQGGCGIFRLD